MYCPGLSWYGVHSPPFRDMLLARSRDILTQVVRPHVARLWLMANGTLVMGMTVTLVFTCLAHRPWFLSRGARYLRSYGTKAFFLMVFTGKCCTNNKTVICYGIYNTLSKRTICVIHQLEILSWHVHRRVVVRHLPSPRQNQKLYTDGTAALASAPPRSDEPTDGCCPPPPATTPLRHS